MVKKVLIIFVLVAAAASTGSLLQYLPVLPEYGRFADFEAPAPPVEKPHVDTTLAFVGDVMFSRNVEEVQKRYGAQYVFDGLPELASTTVLVGNFESPVPKLHTQTPSMGMSFSAPTSTLWSLSDYGFEYLSLANNHTYDKGTDDYYHTWESLESASLVPFGDQYIGTSTVSYAQISGQDIALFGLFALDSYPDMNALGEQFAAAEQQSGWQIAYVHWGIEYELTHSPFQERLAKELIDMGFDSVVGHHPHVVQDIQKYNDAYIFYSLGNFVFDQYWMDSVEDGLWLEMQFSSSSISHTLRPVTTQGSRSQPRFMSAYDSDRFLRALSDRSEAALRLSILSGKLD